ncbi:MAG: response regulator transcription factor [Proteobacteria bacterium]|nr:response regulator transcription factor [Pseudomonadota bacterium]
MQPYQILVVDDDKDLNKLITNFLQTKGYHVQQAFSGENAIYRIENFSYDALLLDYMMPDFSGFQVYQTVHEIYQGIVIMLTANEEDDTHIDALKLGINDFLTKPINPKVLETRLHKHLTKPHTKPSKIQQLQFGKLKLNVISQCVYLDDQKIKLSQSEYKLLKLLCINANAVLSRDSISKTLRGIPYDGLDRSIDIQILNLRKLLQDDRSNPQKIKSIRGKGYVFIADAWE